ncbi:hypothetical protein DFH29DRAFT_873971 [Suillus ampliporus]|nr:hypothetical protein DFH29DRAFT_873971 [Suillus ampliporus]
MAGQPLVAKLLMGQMTPTIIKAGQSFIRKLTRIRYDQTELAIKTHYYMSSFSFRYYYHGVTHICRQRYDNYMQGLADKLGPFSSGIMACIREEKYKEFEFKKKWAAGKGKHMSREHVQGNIELIQGFEFPEASNNKIKKTRDGHHAIATGMYKPQTKILSDDWTKIMHLQNDRTIELHTQGGFHYRTRIPRFGRSLAYHFPSCNALFSASGNEIYRLNLEQGRFLNPLVLQDDNILGVNCININPAHNLLAFSVDGNGSVQFWDPRSRSSVSVLRLPTSRLLQPTAWTTLMPGVDDADALSISVTALASRSDGLSYATKATASQYEMYPGLKAVDLQGTPSSNFVSITSANDLNYIHHVPGSGLFLTANEGIQMATYYDPALGPAPRWASFLENVTEEMEDSMRRSAYEDFKFVERSELKTCIIFHCDFFFFNLRLLGLDHLIGTPALKPYMHGYFLSLHLYDTACVIANPFAYAEHREKLVREWMEKMAETRIRVKKGREGAGAKVNKALVERIAYARTKQNNRRSNANINFVPLVPHTETSASARKMGDKTATFGQWQNAPVHGLASHITTVKGSKEGGFEMSWVPSSNKPREERRSRKDARKGVEVFGAMCFSWIIYFIWTHSNIRMKAPVEDDLRNITTSAGRIERTQDYDMPRNGLRALAGLNARLGLLARDNSSFPKVRLERAGNMCRKCTRGIGHIADVVNVQVKFERFEIAKDISASRTLTRDLGSRS